MCIEAQPDKALHNFVDDDTLEYLYSTLVLLGCGFMSIFSVRLFNKIHQTLIQTKSSRAIQKMIRGG